jgi:hypothetical protein
LAAPAFEDFIATAVREAQQKRLKVSSWPATPASKSTQHTAVRLLDGGTLFGCLCAQSADHLVFQISHQQLGHKAMIALISQQISFKLLFLVVVLLFERDQESIRGERAHN